MPEISIEQIGVVAGFILAVVFGIFLYPRITRALIADAVDEKEAPLRKAYNKVFDEDLLPKVVDVVDAAIAPIVLKVQALDAMLVRLESRIPSTAELAGAVKKELPALPAPPDLAGLERRVLERIPPAVDLEKLKLELTDKVVREIREHLPEVPTANELWELMQPQVAQQINSAWAAASTQINASIASIEALLRKGAARAFGEVGAEAAKAKVLAGKIDQLAKLGGVAADEDEIVKILAVQRSIDRLGPRIGLDAEEIAELKGGLEDLLAVRQDIKGIQEDFGGVTGKGKRAAAGGGYRGV